MERNTLKSLELNSPWTRSYVNNDGGRQFLSSVLDFVYFIGNVLDLFYGIETIIIDIPTYHTRETFTDNLKYRIDFITNSNWNLDRTSSIYPDDDREWRHWGQCHRINGGFVLVGTGLKHDKRVQILCR
jgi:hypothetical protein